MRLLIVDDEPSILSALVRTLRREGYVIETTSSPEEALARIEADAPDVVLSDHRMPRMNGLELLARAARSAPACRRLLLTGGADDLDATALAAARLSAAIPKPWDDAELKQALRGATEKAGLPPATAD